jgi:hypothetical protein
LTLELAVNADPARPSAYSDEEKIVIRWNVYLVENLAVDNAAQFNETSARQGKPCVESRN